ncbi:hypothetical protein TWF730_001535 [Orbilia blumenaviensis]|uniref:F-box domain-containing protein n=1 Tax=Orbilia blumenaviensis TaxID=1796055 RepID=A0AAV9UHX1_9PEZI
MLLNLPVEVVSAVIAHMSPRDCKNFSQCSKLCFSLAFPVLHSKLHIYNDWTRLHNFDEGKWLAPFRRYIRSISFTNVTRIQFVRHRNSYSDPDHRFSANFHSLAAFTNLKRIKIRICESYAGMYGDIVSSLQELPYYDEIQELAFFRYLSVRQTSDPSELERAALDLNGLRLPKYLQSLSLRTGLEAREAFLLALADCKHAKRLVFKGSNGIPEFYLKDPQQPSAYINLSHIKTLTLSLGDLHKYNRRGDWRFRLPPTKISGVEHLEKLYDQFPNLESFSLTTDRYPRSKKSLLGLLPNLPKLGYLQLPWPVAKSFNRTISVIENYIRKWVSEGKMASLHTLELRGEMSIVHQFEKLHVKCEIDQKKSLTTRWFGDMATYLDGDTLYHESSPRAGDEPLGYRDWRTGSESDDPTPPGEDDNDYDIFEDADVTSIQSEEEEEEVEVEEGDHEDQEESEEEEQEQESGYDTDYFEYLDADLSSEDELEELTKGCAEFLGTSRVPYYPRARRHRTLYAL